MVEILKLAHSLHQSLVHMFYDLASLTKPLVTAPLVLKYLDLDLDWRGRLKVDWPGQLTPRHLLSHAAGLPPWLPYIGKPIIEQITAFSGWRRHPLLKESVWGESTYSDLSYRLLAEMLQIETGQDWSSLGKTLTALEYHPWSESPISMPPGEDRDAWKLATSKPFPEPKADFSHDANARAGMLGHAGFGATVESARDFLHVWVPEFSKRMAVETNYSKDGQIWGLGLQRLKNGNNGFVEVLNKTARRGIKVISYDGMAEPPLISPHFPTDPSNWWFHTGYTGTVLFVRPEDLACVMILCHRLKENGTLMTAEELRARRMQILKLS